MSTPLLTLHHPGRAQRYYAAGHWRDETIYTAVRARAARRPDSYAIRQRDRDLTYREVIDEADQLADHFHRLGLRPGDRVGFWGPSGAATAICLLACSRDRLVCVPSL